ncbi:hypothetical protein NMD70_15455 [Edwardsiella tarda]|uniref:baseplate complex protein n=1 Tax=Edwardsiella tarda TaxID=636 RepID=UPI00351C06DC
MSTVMLALNGEQIRMDNMTVTPALQFEEKDKSGQTSSTSTSEQGVKAKELRVNGLIPYKNAKQLTRLFSLAEATGGDNGRQRYRVANATAQAVNFREGIFAGRIDASEQQGLMAWRVQFTLREQRSVSEKKQERVAAPKVSQQTAAGTSTDKAKTKQGEQSGTEATWFERLSKKVNDMIGPAATTEGSADETDKTA